MTVVTALLWIGGAELIKVATCQDASVSSKRAVRLRVLIPVLVNFERECDLQYRPVIVSDVDGDPVPDAVVRAPRIAFLAMSASVRAAPSCMVSRVRNSIPS
jgi:hypothetical protein